MTLPKVLVRLLRVAHARQEDIVYAHLLQLRDVPVRHLEREARLAGHHIETLVDNLSIAGWGRNHAETEALEEGPKQGVVFREHQPPRNSHAPRPLGRFRLRPFHQHVLALREQVRQALAEPSLVRPAVPLAAVVVEVLRPVRELEDVHVTAIRTLPAFERRHRIGAVRHRLEPTEMARLRPLAIGDGRHSDGPGEMRIGRDHDGPVQDGFERGDHSLIERHRTLEGHLPADLRGSRRSCRGSSSRSPGTAPHTALR